MPDIITVQKQNAVTKGGTAVEISVDRETGEVRVAVSEIAAFARSKSAASRRRLNFEYVSCDGEAQGQKDCGGIHPLSLGVNEGGVSFLVEGSADLVYTEREMTVCQIFCERGRITERTNPVWDPTFVAAGVLCAHMLCLERNEEAVRLRLTYVNTSKGLYRSFDCVFQESFLKRMSEMLFLRAAPFVAIQADKYFCMKPSLANIAFPYREIRCGQRDFINDAFRAAKSSSRLLVCAPTGIGKTVSALYPALRALGNGYIDKVFYLTAKTVTGNAAAECCRAISMQAQSLRCVTVMAKERTCPMAPGAGAGSMKLSRRCRECPLMGEIDGVPYGERRDEALLELINNGGRVIDPAMLKSAASAYRLCPYELSLDVSEYCECIICDYNYVFDPSVRFIRYFAPEHRNKKYMLLVDEAHNLPDRAREMYSARINAADFLRLSKQLENRLPGASPVKEGLDSVLKKLRETAILCKGEERVMPDGESGGYYLSDSPVPGFFEALLQFCRAAGASSRDDDEMSLLLAPAYDSAMGFVKSLGLFDSGFQFYAQLKGGRLSVSSRCLDPSAMLDKMLSCADSAVLFSATLTPMAYFADVLGCKDAPCLELDSPYDPERLCLAAVDSVSTRYGDREEGAGEIAEIILSTVEAKEGNYIVYFPSYEYMKQVYREFCQCAPDIRCVVQKQGMSHEARNQFLIAFSKNRKEGGGTLVGFCVLGGAFAEGVDLRGESLIGVIIVGTGLPKITAEQNILRDYFERTRENGYDYAYTYPAMIKVLQAVGRVIRSENDRGVAVLVDDRYAEPGVYRLFPKHWKHIRYTGDPYSLQGFLEKFWLDGGK